MNIRTRKHPLLRGIGLALALGSAAGLAAQASAKDVTWEDIANDAQTTENVLGYGIGPKAQRYSPMTTINRDNVERLVPAWSFSFGDEKQRGQESQALVH
ncbi:MAG: PQQ-dependent dehydrogenase, methanol/ethanol family, partial [Marinobacter sp.]